MTWEYKIIFICMESEDEDGYEASLHNGVHLLNELGSDGWELINYLPHHMAGNRTKYHALLKRQKTG